MVATVLLCDWEIIGSSCGNNLFAKAAFKGNPPLILAKQVASCTKDTLYFRGLEQLHLGCVYFLEAIIEDVAFI